MSIENDSRFVVAENGSQRLALGGPLKRMIAVHIDAVFRRSLEGFRSVRVGPRHDHHIDPCKQAGEIPLSQPLCKSQHRLSAGWLVAMLLPDEQNRRTALVLELGILSRRRKEQRWNGTALLGLASDAQAHRAGPPVEIGEETHHLCVRGEIGSTRRKGGRRVLDRRIRIACSDRRALLVVLLRVVLTPRRASPGRRRRQARRRERHKVSDGPTAKDELTWPFPFCARLCRN